MMMYLKLYSKCWKNGLKIMTQVINNIYETGEWPKDLTDFKMNDCLKEEAKSYKML